MLTCAHSDDVICTFNNRPASLHVFVETAQRLQLDPFPQPAPETSPTAAAKSGGRGKGKGKGSSSSGSSSGSGSSSTSRQHWRGTSAKKRIEIEQMAACISASCKSLNASAVVDVGSGMSSVPLVCCAHHCSRILDSCVVYYGFALAEYTVQLVATPSIDRRCAEISLATAISHLALPFQPRLQYIRLSATSRYCLCCTDWDPSLILGVDAAARCRSRGVHFTGTTRTLTSTASRL